MQRANLQKNLLFGLFAYILEQLILKKQKNKTTKKKSICRVWNEVHSVQFAMKFQYVQLTMKFQCVQLAMKFQCVQFAMKFQCVQFAMKFHCKLYRFFQNQWFQ